MIIKPASTDVSVPMALVNKTTGLAATGLTINTIDLQYTRVGSAPAAKVDATALAATDTAHTDNFAIELDATDQPGAYRVDWPDAAFASGVKFVLLTALHADCHPAHLVVQLANVPADVVNVNGGTAAALSTIDGVSLESFYEALLAYVAGKRVVTDNGATRTIVWTKRDGSTAKITITAASETDGSSSAVGTLG